LSSPDYVTVSHYISGVAGSRVELQLGGMGQSAPQLGVAPIHSSAPNHVSFLVQEVALSSFLTN